MIPLGVLPQSATADVSPDTLALLDAFGQRSYLNAKREADARAVVGYTVPLGAIQKIRGQWAPRKSERLSGTLHRYTWQVANGFSSGEVINDLVDELSSDVRFELIFTCEARACGSSVQWANRVFEERLLYGREVSQRYFVYKVVEATDSVSAQEDESVLARPERSGESVGRLLLYASARSTNRQYLHGEFLQETAE
ncbi:MAG: DUF4892 domain-containing protein [Pseudomonadota bacterium]